MSERLHVAVDLDDVTVSFMPSVMASFELEFGVRPDFDGQSWGDQAKAFYHHPAFIAAGYKSWWGWLRDREWLWAQFQPVPGAIGGIKRLRASGYYVEAVTSKPEWAEHNVWKWLGRWRPAFQRVTVITNGTAKVDFTDADVMVDDKLETCKEFVDDGRYAIHFAPWSIDGFTGRLYTATSWQQVLFAVEDIRDREGVRSGV